MKAIKRVAAGTLALMMAMGISACGSGSKDESSVVEKKLDESQQEILEQNSEEMEMRELESAEITWFSFYDINPTESEDKEIGADLALFQTKYNGKVIYKQTTWETKFDDLAALVMSNDAPDFIGADDMDVFPKGALKNMIQPVDDVIDYTSPLYVDVAASAEQFKYGDDHYVAVIRTDPCYICVYNKKQIEDLGMDDPAELYHNGEWNWDTFCNMCIEFSEPENDKYALDAWYYDSALLQSTGVPLVGLENGEIVNNINDPKIEKAENMMYELQKNNVCYPKNEHEWKVRGDTFGTGLATGECLFYIIGLWGIEDAPSVTAPYGDVAAGEVMFVPVPCSADSDAIYVPSRVHGYCIPRGASNPEGVAAFMDCQRYCEMDANIHQITLEQLKDDYGWTDEMLEMRDEVYALAAEHPVFEFASGVSADLSNLIDGVVKGVMNPAEQKTWSALRDENGKAIDALIKQATTTD